MAKISRLVVITMMLAGCASRPAAAPAIATAPATAATTPASVAAPVSNRVCPAPLTTPFAVVPQSGMGATPELQFSKDGRMAAAKSAHEIQLWNVTSGTKVAVIANDGPISKWALRPDGRMVAIASEGHLSLVDPTSRAAAIKVALPANVERVDWRSDGKVVFATRAQETSVVDVAGTVTATVAAAGAISADGRSLFSRDGAMWDVATNKSRWKAATPSATATFSADGQSVALVMGQSITVLDSATGAKRWEATTKGDLGTGGVALSPDGQSAAAYDNGETTEKGYENRGMALWNRGKRMRMQSTDAAPESRAAFSPDGKLVGFISSGSLGQELRLADGRTGGRVKQPKNIGDAGIDPPHWSADGRAILLPGANGLVVLDVAKGERRVIGKLTPEATSLNATTSYRDAVWSPDDSAVLILAEQGVRSIATVIDLKTGATRQTIDGKRARAAEWNAATGLIAIEREDGVALWDGQAKQPARVVDTGESSDAERRVAFSPQGTMLATLASPYKEVRLWDPKTGARLRALSVASSGATGEDGMTESTMIEGMAFSADGTRIALQAVLSFGSEQSTHIAIFETASGTLVRTLHAQRRYAYTSPTGKSGVHFTPQGKGIVSIDESGHVDLWSTTTDDPPTPLIERATPGPSTVADSGDLLVMGSPTLGVWDLRTRTLSREFRSDESPILDARLSRSAGAIVVTRPDRVELRRFTDRAYLTLRVAPFSMTPSTLIVADNGAFMGPSSAAVTATAPLRVRDGSELEVRSLRPNELGVLSRPTLALDFVGGCAQ